MKKRVVIIGGGFAGLSTAVHLSRHVKPSDNVEILLIDRQPEHVYLPLIYEIASGGLTQAGKKKALKRGASFVFDLDGKLIDHRSISFRQGDVLNVDIDKNSIKLTSGATISFNYLVLAMGAKSRTFGIDGVDKNALPLMNMDNALAIRERFSEMITECGKKLRSGVELVVVGGGPNGVEIASEIAVAIDGVKRETKIMCEWKITIVDSGEKILSQLNRLASWIVRRRLLKLGITTSIATIVKSVKPTFVIVEPNDKLKSVSPYSKPTRLKSDITIWTAGVEARSEWANWGLPTDDRGYIKALSTLQVYGVDHVFVAGDAASIVGRRMQQRAPEAVDQGKSVAENLYRIISDKPVLRDHKDRTWPFAIPLGGMNAVSSIGPITLFGIFGYALRKAIDLRYFCSIFPVARAVTTWVRGCKTYIEND